jgi:hypothetical protein
VRTSFALGQGVLWIARSVTVGRLVPFDVNGRRLGPGFSFRGIDEGPTQLGGLAIDDDRRLWVADAASGALRAFTAFGTEVATVRSAERPELDRPSAFGDPAGIAARGVESEARLLVSRRGTRRHALQLVDAARGTVQSLRPGGEPEGRFHGLAGVALSGGLGYACETGRRAVQVFRGAEFHFRIEMPGAPRGEQAFVPRAVAALADGRCVVGCDGPGGGGVFLFDAGGRLLRCLAEGERGDPTEAGGVEDPSGIAVHEGADDRGSLVLVLDRDGERVQAFTLAGASLGCFPELDLEPGGAGVEVRTPARRPRPG